MLLAILYTFQGMVKPVFHQLEKTSVITIGIICGSCVLYECLEGWVTYSLARTYKKDFKYRHGVGSAFYACFYRVATLGSGSGVSIIYYLHEKGMEYSTATGMYLMEYLLHKISIALLSLFFLLVNIGFFYHTFEKYVPLLYSGYILTAIISALFFLFCISSKLHYFFLILLEKINKKLGGKLKGQLLYAAEYLKIMEQATKDLLQDKKLVFTTILKNFLKLLFWYGIPYVILYQTHLLRLQQAIAITSISILLAAVIPAPAGIGAIEFVMILLFARIVGKDLAICTSLLYRFATFVFPFFIGAGYIIIRRVRHRMRRSKSRE